MPVELVEPVDRPRRKQEERSRSAREKLLLAAIKLVAEHGVDRFTLAAVGESAGYSRAHPAKYFGDKAGLLRAVADHIFRARKWGESEGFAGIEGFVNSFLSDADLVEKRCEIVLVSAALTEPDLGKYVRAANQGRVDKIAARLAAAIDAKIVLDSVDPAAMAIVVTSGVRGALAQWLLQPDGVKLDALRREFWDTLQYSMALSH